jgi:hypothetical protein
VTREVRDSKRKKRKERKREGECGMKEVGKRAEGSVRESETESD